MRPTTPEQMGAAIARNLPDRTGHTLEEWVEILLADGPKTRKERVQWLKSVHLLGHVQAQFVVGKAEEPADYVPSTDEELLEAQYSGPKAALRPIYDRLAEAVRDLGDDAHLDMRKTYVSIGRRRQFGIIQASTRSRVDLGLRLPGIQPHGRLEAAGSLGNDQVTHRIALTSPEEVDEELVGWLRAAYGRGA